MRKSNLFGCSVRYAFIFTFSVSCGGDHSGRRCTGGKKGRSGSRDKEVGDTAGNEEQVVLFSMMQENKGMQAFISFH